MAKQSPMYKEPTEAQRKKIQAARKKTVEGMKGEKDIFSKVSPVMKKQAREHYAEGREEMQKIPEPVRRMEAEEGMGPVGPYKKGGWIKDAIKKPGALRSSLGVKKGQTIPAKKLNAAAQKPGKMGQRARLAKTLKGFK
jgi:hypothetical protein